MELVRKQPLSWILSPYQGKEATSKKGCFLINKKVIKIIKNIKYKL